MTSAPEPKNPSPSNPALRWLIWVVLGLVAFNLALLWRVFAPSPSPEPAAPAATNALQPTPSATSTNH